MLGQQWCLLENVSPDVLNYPIDLACDKLVEALPTSTPVPPTPRPIIPVTKEAEELLPTSTPTPSYVQNWCDPGGAWGDGRCNDPDPAVRDWYYNAGWYFAQVDAGVLSPQDVPPQYNPPTPTSDSYSSSASAPSFSIGYTCGTSMQVTWDGLPAGAVLNVADSNINSYPSGSGGVTGATAPSGAGPSMCTSGSYTTTYTVTGTLSLSGLISGTCTPAC